MDQYNNQSSNSHLSQYPKQLDRQNNQEIDRSNHQEFNEQNIEYAAQFYKRFISLQAAENIKGEEDHHLNRQNIGFQLNESHASDHAETPQFGTRIDYQGVQETEVIREELSAGPNVSNNCMKVSNQKNQLQVKQISDEVQKQESNVLFPLYGIDHSKQFFQACPQLSALLKKYKDFVKCYCSGKILSKSFEEGCSLNEGLALNGSQLKQLGKAVFRNVFRRMQQYIFNICKRNIVKISEIDVLRLTQYILKESTLKQDSIQILKKIMKLSFDIPSQITQEDVFLFYSFLMRWLAQQNTSDHIQFEYDWDDSKPRFIWNHQKQMQFCQQYEAKKSLIFVMNSMNAENIQPKVTILDLRYKLQQLIKFAFKITQTELKKYEKKEIRLPMTQNDLKSIARDAKSLPLRLLLLKIKNKKHVFLEDIKKIIIAIDSFYKDETKQKQHIKQIQVNKSKNRITSDSQSSEDNHGSSKPSQYQASEKYQVSSKINKQKAIYFVNHSGPKYHQQKIFDNDEKKHLKSKVQKMGSSNSTNIYLKNRSSQIDRISSKLKSGQKQK